MSRATTYQVKLGKIVVGGVRNIDSYYVVLRSDKLQAKYISRAMRIDEDNEDEITPEVDIRPTLLELWNYDKMRLVDKFKLDFKAQHRFTWTVFEDNLELAVERSNEWEEEIMHRKRSEEIAQAEEAEAREASNMGSGKGSNRMLPPPQRSEAASSKIASNTPSKAIKSSQHSQQSKRETGSLMLPPPSSKRFSDSIAKPSSKPDSEIKIESIAMVEY